MSIRTVGHASWTGNTGAVRVDLSITREGEGGDTERLPSMLIPYSRYTDNTYDLAAATPYTLTLQSKVAVMFIIPPELSVPITVAGNSDTGYKTLPQGIIMLTFDTTTPPTTIVLTAASALAGVRVITI
jgi:hypothetical protein